MKNKCKVWIIAIVAVIGFSFIACDEDKDNGDGEPGKVTFEFAPIPAGSFSMGSPAAEPGRTAIETVHTVTLSKGFSMSKSPITQAQYIAVIGSNPSNTIGGNMPVVNVSWYDAIVFCNKLSMQENLTPAYSINGSTDPEDWSDANEGQWKATSIVANSTGYRLPTEAQWEYACRAGTTKAFNWDDDSIDSSKANYNASVVDATNTTAGTNPGKITAVKSYEPNEWGLYDMHGNVLEWCWDWYGTLAATAVTDPTGAAGPGARVVRGGSYLSAGNSLRSAWRSSDPYTPDNRSVTIGFRIIRP